MGRNCCNYARLQQSHCISGLQKLLQPGHLESNSDGLLSLYCSLCQFYVGELGLFWLLASCERIELLGYLVVTMHQPLQWLIKPTLVTTYYQIQVQIFIGLSIKCQPLKLLFSVELVHTNA